MLSISVHTEEEFSQDRKGQDVTDRQRDACHRGNR